MKLQSNAFTEGAAIPDKYSREGGNASPPLAWNGVPKNAKSLALVVDDPDAAGGDFVHWLVYNIPPEMTHFEEGASAAMRLPDGARQGKNGFGQTGYGGPQPPSGTHRYVFHLYALDSKLELPPGATRAQLDHAMHGHEIEECSHTGKYQHP
jgi:Raf kinase inhibitor-like YbhB/YbcL family protein